MKIDGTVNEVFCENGQLSVHQFQFIQIRLINIEEFRVEFSV